MLPEGVIYHSSWLEPSGKRVYEELAGWNLLGQSYVEYLHTRRGAQRQNGIRIWHTIR
jgi:hypothetical protein